jgi:hypothetical protein
MRSQALEVSAATPDSLTPGCEQGRKAPRVFLERLNPQQFGALVGFAGAVETGQGHL